MAYHIVLPRALSAAEAGASRPGGDRPGNAIAMLARELGAEVHSPRSDEPTVWSDAIRSKLAGSPVIWGMARRLVAQLGPKDVVFCSSEAGGLHVAACCDTGAGKPKVCVFVHNLDRPRGRAALKLFGLRRRVDLLLACAEPQVEFLRSFLNLPDDRARFIWDHTDNRFFTPGPASADKQRPMIVSVGLEKRDYRTLAAATSDLDVDVRVSGFSEDAAVLSQTFPPELPSNMTRRFYSWPDLVQLYRDADVVVVSVHENFYAAGVQNLMEAMACGRPVVATASIGLRKYLDERCVVCVPPGDPAAMRRAVTDLLADRSKAEALGRRGRELANQRHGIERYVAEIAGHLRTLAADTGMKPSDTAPR